MCNSQNEQIVRDVVAAMVASSQPFTCWDISRESWRKGADEPHRVLKGSVHGMFNNGEMAGFDRASIQTPTGQALCYFPVGEFTKLTDYTASIGGSVDAGVFHAPSSSVAQPAAPDVGDNGNSAADDVSDFERKQATDKDGRLPIWSDMLRSIGLKKQGTVVFVGTDSHVLFVSDNVPGASVANYSINKDGRIRIGDNTLAILESKSGTYNVKLNTSEKQIEISAL